MVDRILKNPTISAIYDLCRANKIRIKGADPCPHANDTQYDIYEIGATGDAKTWYSCARCFYEKQQPMAIYYTFINGKYVMPYVIPDSLYKLYKCDCGLEHKVNKCYRCKRSICLDCTNTTLCDDCSMFSNTYCKCIERTCSVCEKRVCEDCEDIVDEVVYCPTCTPTGKCEVCHVTDIGNSNASPPWFNCDVCSRETCHNCCALTWCQTVDCICKQCFDCKCEECGNTLEVPNTEDIWFCGDGDIENKPLCKKCMANVNVDSESR